jgi:tetratricopeptide (TPR) repeat protein
MDEAEWEQQIAATWASADELSEGELLAAIEGLAAYAPAGTGAGVYERASALDSTGHSDLAIPLYEEALEIGLSGGRRREAVIQMASSLRNLGRAEESVALLRAELEAESDELDDAVRAFLALALTDTGGGEREATSLALLALARHLPRYERSVTNYARELVDPPRPEQ